VISVAHVDGPHGNVIPKVGQNSIPDQITQGLAVPLEPCPVPCPFTECGSNAVGLNQPELAGGEERRQDALRQINVIEGDSVAINRAKIKLYLARIDDICNIYLVL
jgi:hypothetical protein